MEQNLADMLSSAISNSYGTYYGAVFSAISTKSRTNIQGLLQALPASNEKDIRLALSTLVQQHIVRYHTDKATGATFYEPNWEHAYNYSSRAPTLYRFVEQRYNSQVAKVFEGICKAGTTKVGDLVDRLMQLPTKSKKSQKSAEATENGEEEQTTAPATNGENHDHATNHSSHAETNGVTNGKTNGDVQPTKPANKQADPFTCEDIYGALNLLLTSEYIIPVHKRQFWPSYDRHGEAVMYVNNGDPLPAGLSGKKERENTQYNAMQTLKKWRREDKALPTPGLNGNLKRAHSEDSDDEEGQKSFKRTRVNGQGFNGVNGQIGTWLSAHQQPLDDHLVLTANFEKCNVGLRNNQLVRFCERYVTYNTSRVFDAFLRVLEVDITRCYDPLSERLPGERDFSAGVASKPLDWDLGTSEAVTTKQIAQLLDPDIDLDEGLPPDADIVDSVEHTNGHTPSRNGDLSSYERQRRIQQHLNILICDPRGFVNLNHDRQYTVPFHALTQRLIEYELENTITHSFGMLPARIIRILKFYGNLEVWSIATRAMVTQDNARKALVVLQKAGWVDVMELPKNARREVMRSSWVHQYDVLRAREKHLSDCYFAMSRLHMRLASETAKVQRVIDKSERTDVVGNEDRLLNQEEKEVLEKHKKRKEMIWKQIGRLDELVALTRDFSKMEYPHRLWDLGWVDSRRLSSNEPTPAYEPGSSEDEGEAIEDEVDDEEPEVAA